MSNPWSDIYKDLRAPYLQEKKAKKDYDGDGKVESGSKEHAGSVHNAIQKAKGGKADGKDTRKEEYGCSSDSPIKVTKKKKKEAKEEVVQEDLSKIKDTVVSNYKKFYSKTPAGKIVNKVKDAAPLAVGVAKKLAQGTTGDGYIGHKSLGIKNPLVKKEHHQKDADGKVIDHDDTTPSSVEETITLTRGDYGSRNVSTSAYAVGKSKGFKGYKAGGGLGPNFLPIKLANSYEPAKVNKPNYYDWREDFVWQDEVEEAIKRPKLEIQEKGVKNKIEVNPDDGLKEEKKKLKSEGRSRKLIPDVKVVKKSAKDMSKPAGTTGGVDYRLMAQSYQPEGEVIDEN